MFDIQFALQVLNNVVTALASVKAVYVNESLTVFPNAMLEEATCRAVNQLLPIILFNEKASELCLEEATILSSTLMRPSPCK